MSAISPRATIATPRRHAECGRLGETATGTTTLMMSARVPRGIIVLSSVTFLCPFDLRLTGQPHNIHPPPGQTSIHNPTAALANTMTPAYIRPLHTTAWEPSTETRERMGRAMPIEAKKMGARIVSRGGRRYVVNVVCGVEAVDCPVEFTSPAGGGEGDKT
jgi:hypothetical protein